MATENPMDRGAWQAAVHGVARVGHDWVTSLSLFTFMHWRRKWQPTPVFLPGESQGRGSVVGCRLWGRTESDTTEVTQQQQQYKYNLIFSFFKLSYLYLPFYFSRSTLELPCPPNILCNLIIVLILNWISVFLTMRFFSLEFKTGISLYVHVPILPQTPSHPWIHVYVWFSPFTVLLKLPPHC